MKISISMKNPDCVYDAVDEAVREEVRSIPGLNGEEEDGIHATRLEKTFEKLEK